MVAASFYNPKTLAVIIKLLINPKENDMGLAHKTFGIV